LRDYRNASTALSALPTSVILEYRFPFLRSERPRINSRRWVTPTASGTHQEIKKCFNAVVLPQVDCLSGKQGPRDFPEGQHVGAALRRHILAANMHPVVSCTKFAGTVWSIAKVTKRIFPLPVPESFTIL